MNKYGDVTNKKTITVMQSLGLTRPGIEHRATISTRRSIDSNH